MHHRMPSHALIYHSSIDESRNKFNCSEIGWVAPLLIIHNALPLMHYRKVKARGLISMALIGGENIWGALSKLKDSRITKGNSVKVFMRM